MTSTNFILCRRYVICLIFCAFIAASPASAHTDIELQIESLDKQIQSESDNADLYLKRAELHRRHLSWDKALTDFTSAEKYGVKRDVLYFYLGRLYRESNQEGKALINLTAAIETHPDYALAYIERSKLSSRTKLEAVRDLDIAISLLEKPSPDLFLDRAKLLASAGSEYFDQMMSGLQDGIDKLGSIVSLIEFSVNHCMSQQKWTTAQKQIEQLPQLLRQSPKWLFIEGQNHGHLNNNDLAQKLYQQALDKIAKLPIARSNSSAMLQLKNEILTALNE